MCAIFYVLRSGATVSRKRRGDLSVSEEHACSGVPVCNRISIFFSLEMCFFFKVFSALLAMDR